MSAYKTDSTLQEIERARGYTWASYFGSWTWYAAAAMLVGMGLVEDLAPQWASTYFFSTGVVALLVAGVGRTRKGQVLLRLPVTPRSAVLGTGHRGSTRSKALLIVVWGLTVTLAAVSFIGMLESTQGGNKAQSEPPVPATVLFGVLALAWVGVSLVGQRWAARKMDRNARA
ncbi:hypothetical protein [Streptomyces kronopolitis]|uniref:hypothetical protein n=1 Tax=Streptomyces kronopolitis TaxID=1612435 RepID=UPI003D95640F